MLLTTYLLLLFTCALQNTHAGGGTTKNIQTIVMGRCAQYQQLSGWSPDSPMVNNASCAQVWSRFNTTFAFKDACQTPITKADYAGLFSALKNNRWMEDNTLFWSSTRTVSHDYTHIKDNKLFTLEDTFTGYLFNNLNWCGCKSCSVDGINYKSCNKSCSSATNSFWSLASQTYAGSAKGVVHVMLNGTTMEHNTAYYRGSFFGTDELPALGRNKNVEEMIVLVADDLDRPPKEKCGEDSLADLEEDAAKYGIPSMKCIDDPQDVYHLLCAKYKNAEACRRLEDYQTWKTLAIVFIVVTCFLILLFTLYLICHKTDRTT